LAPEWLLVLPNVEKFTDWNEGIKILPPLEQVQTVMKIRGLSCVYMSEASSLKTQATIGCTWTAQHQRGSSILFRKIFSPVPYGSQLWATKLIILWKTSELFEQKS
jgi:hypothetical protein